MRLHELVRRGQIVKICGLREPEHAAIAAAAGADLIGFIFAPARRQVTAEVAKSCIEAAKAVRPDVLAVGVFVDAPPNDMLDVVEAAGLDVVQLNGAKLGAASELPKVEAIQALRPAPGTGVESVVARVDDQLRAKKPPAAFLIDALVAGAAGGTGERADWELARHVCAQRQVMLAGGLDPANVSDAIQRVRPAGVDVSSGVEVGGSKDAGQIVSFIRAAKSAFRDLR